MTNQESESSQAKPQPAGVADPKSLRVGFWQNLGMAIGHIRGSISSEGSRLRGSDYISIVALPLAAFLLCATNFMSNGLAMRPWFVLFLLVALLYFTASRIGVVKSFSPRQAHLVWTMLVSMFIAGAVFTLLFFEILRIL